MARILYISLGSPIPTTNGHRMRSRSLLQALRFQGHEVVMICCAEQAELDEAGDLDSLVSQKIMVPMTSGKGFDSYIGRLTALLLQKPYGVWRFRQPAIEKAISDSLARQHFDAIYCDDIYMYSNIHESVTVPVLLNKDDITFEIVEQYAKDARWPASTYAGIEAGRVRKFEVLTCNRATAVLACSERDGLALQQAGVTAPVHVLPNVIDVNLYYRPVGQPEQNTLLYVGAMDWYPNIDGVQYFIEQILPLILAKIPNARFVVAGRNPSPELVAKYEGNKNVEFTGTVKDIVPYLSSATVCVVPLRIGSGTRLKIIEAAAAAKAVVSTTLGADGLTFQENTEIVRADDPQSFASQVVTLLRDPNKRFAMGAAARERAESEYSIGALQKIIGETLQDIIMRQRTSAEVRSFQTT